MSNFRCCELGSFRPHISHLTEDPVEDGKLSQKSTWPSCKSTRVSESSVKGCSVVRVGYSGLYSVIYCVSRLMSSFKPLDTGEPLSQLLRLLFGWTFTGQNGSTHVWLNDCKTQDWYFITYTTIFRLREDTFFFLWLHNCREDARQSSVFVFFIHKGNPATLTGNETITRQ